MCARKTNLANEGLSLISVDRSNIAAATRPLCYLQYPVRFKSSTDSCIFSDKIMCQNETTAKTAKTTTTKVTMTMMALFKCCWRCCSSSIRCCCRTVSTSLCSPTHLRRCAFPAALDRVRVLCYSTGYYYSVVHLLRPKLQRRSSAADGGGSGKG